MKFNLDALIGIATSIKPKFGEACNNCGWCCMTGVCPVGQDLSGSDELPCKFLEGSGDNKYHCVLAGDNKLADSVLGIGTGCDAKTQTEQIFEMMEGAG